MNTPGSEGDALMHTGNIPAVHQAIEADRRSQRRQPTEDEIAEAREELARDRAIRARAWRNMLAHFRGEPPEYEEEEEEDAEA